jgi:hypothetical protein
LEVKIVFCSNCGAELAEGAKFCSECGTKVEETQAKKFETHAFDEPVGVQEKVEEKAMSMEEAFKEKVSFDWSNVIDEPQKKEVPQSIKSPWATTTESIDERELYAEMTQSDDKNRTMNFIDVLKADKEERERAAMDRSIEYTEVLEIDPELLGGVKPPKLHYAPLYEDVDEPVKTPFDLDDTVDAYATGQLDRLHIEEAVKEEAPAPEAPVSEPASPKFELPDFLKKAKEFVGVSDEKEDFDRIEKVEEPVAEELTAAFDLSDIEETVDDVEEVVEDKVEESLAEAVEEVSEAVTDDTANLYLDLEMTSSEVGTERVSRATAHALAGDYDDDDEEDIEETVDEAQLFTEMSETPGSKSGMTIAAPADEEAEIEALKRRLAELTGTVEMDPSLLNEEEKEPVVEVPEVEVPEVEVKEDEPELDDFTFEPEVTSAEDKLFAGLASASEIKLQDAVAVDEPTADEAIDFAAPKLDDFIFEPEVTPEDDKLFAGLTPASEVAAPEVAAPVAEEPVFEIPAVETPAVETPAVEEPVFEVPAVETPVVEAPAAALVEEAVVPKLDIKPPATTGLSAEQQSAFDSLVFDLPKEEVAPIEPEIPAFTAEPEIPAFTAEPEIPAFTAEPEAPVVNEEPVAPSVGLEPEMPAVSEEPAVPSMGLEPSTPSVEAEPEAPVLLDFASLMAEKQSAEPPKPTDAVSLEDLEQDLFGPVDGAEEAEAETTKKIDKFYTLYRKNEEFQRLLDEEYSRLKGEHIEISQEEVDKELGITGAAPIAGAAAVGAAGAAIAAAVDKPAEAAAPAATQASQDVAAALEELSKESRPVEDATIYQMEMPEELKELAQKAEDKTGLAADAAAEAAPAAKPEKKGLFGKSKKDKKDKKKKEDNGASFGLNGEEVAGAAAGTAAVATAGAVAANAEAGAEQAQVAAPATTQPEVVYQDVDSGSTILTILAILVALLLIFLLAIILIMHLAPDSNIALTVDQVIENITSRFSALDTMNGLKWL